MNVQMATLLVPSSPRVGIPTGPTSVTVKMAMFWMTPTHVPFVIASRTAKIVVLPVHVRLLTRRHVTMSMVPVHARLDGREQNATMILMNVRPRALSAVQMPTVQIQ